MGVDSARNVPSRASLVLHRPPSASLAPHLPPRRWWCCDLAPPSRLVAHFCSLGGVRPRATSPPTLPTETHSPSADASAPLSPPTPPLAVTISGLPARELQLAGARSGRPLARSRGRAQRPPPPRWPAAARWLAMASRSPLARHERSARRRLQPRARWRGGRATTRRRLGCRARLVARLVARLARPRRRGAGRDPHRGSWPRPAAAAAARWLATRRVAAAVPRRAAAAAPRWRCRCCASASATAS